jgi:hypothetical protein
MEGDADSDLSSLIDGVDFEGGVATDSDAEDQPLGAAPPPPPPQPAAAQRWETKHSTTKLLDGGTTVTASNNYLPAYCTDVEMQDGVWEWRVRGTHWERASAGICRANAVEQNQWLGGDDSARVFSAQPSQVNMRDLCRPHREVNELTLTLDCHRRTLAVAADGEPLPVVTFTDLPRGATWLAAAGCNHEDSSVTLLGFALSETAVPAAEDPCVGDGVQTTAATAAAAMLPAASAAPAVFGLNKRHRSDQLVGGGGGGSGAGGGDSSSSSSSSSSDDDDDDEAEHD